MTQSIGMNERTLHITIRERERTGDNDRNNNNMDLSDVDNTRINICIL